LYEVPEAIHSLIDHNLKRWRVNQVESLFLPEDVKNILSIPISPHCPEDKLIWGATPHGGYTVSSAYRVLAEAEQMKEGESSNGNVKRKLWRSLWSVAMPNNIKVFAWRVLHNALPTMANLEKRKIIDNPWCPQCGLQSETLNHALWECDEIRSYWEESNLMITELAQYRDFDEAMWTILDHEEHGMIEEFWVFCWHIWKYRNKKVFEGWKTTAKVVHAAAQMTLTEYQHA
jgi:hypothetical protein